MPVTSYKPNRNLKF
ncbi:unnamed protein product [Acanthoscelides obtectus]|uniref:Uncharacterized protein n=1 Tax=Acanthoscelides obtectus TaxID=200917 RepID=A0A9P0JZE0_ACAOB|nr:unnamed protein product [Acanthoscelides obtectus]CAK1621917.1 hypothetical protein AOBTE_LOCUS1216 [Acanthoscelides obtectus]